MGWIVFLLNLCAEVLTPVSQNVTVFRDRVFKEVIKATGMGPIQYDWCPYRKRLGHRHLWRERPCEDTGKRCPSTSQGEKPGTNPSLTTLKRNQPCQHLGLSLQNCETINFLFNAPSLWYTAMAVLANYLTHHRMDPQVAGGLWLIY